MDKFKEIINSFFEEENISDKFESNFNNRVNGFANFTCSSVDQYINQINNNECFDMFFLFAFNWSRSVEGDSFWLDIAKKWEKLLFDKGIINKLKLTKDRKRL